jgi:GntR family transcriptional regulator
MADDVVVAIESTTIPAHFLPQPGAVGETLYGYFDAHGILPVRALQHIRAVNANAEQAALAGVKEGEAMLHITRVGYLETGEAIELTHSYCRSNYYDFVVELRR